MSETPVPVSGPPTLAHGVNLASIFRRGIEWIPPRARLAVCLGATVLVGLAIYSYLAGDSGTLNVTFHHNLQMADLSVSIDGRPTFSDQVPGTVKKRFGILDKKVEGTLSRTLAVPLGTHVVQVRVRSSSERFDQTRQISVNLASGKESTVAITAQRDDLSLSYRGRPVAAVKEETQIPGPLRSILVTVMGSVVSASIGFLVQEFLKGRKAAIVDNRNSKTAS